MSLSNAISEVKEELKKGSKLTPELIAEIAEDNEINPKLLERKLQENNITEESVKNFAEASKSNHEERFQAALQKAIKYYGLPAEDDRRYEVIQKGVRYTVLCRVNKHIVALNHEDLRLYDCNFEWFRQAKKVEKNNA